MAEARLYLASASPRRRLLVQSLGLPVTVGLSPVDEDALQAAYTGPNDGLGEYLARRKAEGAARFLAEVANVGAPDDELLVVGADTTVLLDDHVLGKPANAAEAMRMLRRLRGRQHIVVTGVAVARPNTANHSLDVRSARVVTTVEMRAFSDDEIAAYVATGDPLDKAGAYAVQHGEFKPVARIEGCYTAVVGLPLCALAALITEMTGSTLQPSPARAGYPGGIHLSRQATPDHSPCPWSDQCHAPIPSFTRPQAR